MPMKSGPPRPMPECKPRPIRKTNGGDVLLSVACGCVVRDSGSKHIAISPCPAHLEAVGMLDALGNVVTQLEKTNEQVSGSGD